jgi:FkbM family methyltransferase
MSREISRRFTRRLEDFIYPLIGRRRSSDIFPDLVCKVTAGIDSFYFIQVGANDGNDILLTLTRELGLHGCLIEPQTAAFEQLRRSYAAVPGVTFERAAISATDAELALYTADNSWLIANNVVGWNNPSGSASFRREHIERHLRKYAGAAPDAAIIGMTVPAITFTTLIARHHISRIDLLQIDAEGYDAEIVRLFEVERWRPRIIRWERRWLSTVDQRATVQRLENAGYRVCKASADSIALLQRG